MSGKWDFAGNMTRTIRQWNSTYCVGHPIPVIVLLLRITSILNYLLLPTKWSYIWRLNRNKATWHQCELMYRLHEPWLVSCMFSITKSWINFQSLPRKLVSSDSVIYCLRWKPGNWRTDVEWYMYKQTTRYVWNTPHSDITPCGASYPKSHPWTVKYIWSVAPKMELLLQLWAFV